MGFLGQNKEARGPETKKHLDYNIMHVVLFIYYYVNVNKYY